MIQRALISVSDKTGVAALARRLAARGVALISTGGTAAHLEAEGIACQQVAEVTRFPEMLDGRVKTLHPRLFGAILADRDVPAHRADVERHGLGAIDLVVVNLYPFEQTVARPGVALAEAIEKIDVGGPSLLRAAAKNHRHVVVLTDPQDYEPFLAELEASGDVSPEMRFRLAAKVFARTAAYDAAIAAYLTAQEGGGAEAEPSAPPLSLALDLRRRQQLRYGENPHQSAALYVAGSESSGIPAARQLGGKELSFNNLLDLDAAWRLARELPSPAAVVVKHTTPCGAATAASGRQAFAAARACDPVSAFGGVIAVSTPIDGALAEEIIEQFVEAVVAPSFNDEALAVFARKGAVRLLAADFTGQSTVGWDAKRIAGGWLVQQWDSPADEAGWRDAGRRPASPEERRDAHFAWTVCRHVKSNAIVFARDGRTVAIGGGQTSRVDSCRIAADKGGELLRGSVAASDGFFPFADGVLAIAAAGATAIVQPGGSIRDAEVVAAADEHGLAMLLTGRRHFRH